MKKIIILAAAVILAAACGQKEEQKALVLYYSQTGTTEIVAEAIQSLTGADIESVVPVVPYDGDYAATIERGRKELTEGDFPEIQPIAADISKYDVIFIGYPIWFGTYAPPIETLINTADFSGKKVVPFCTFGSGGLDTSSKALKEKLADSEVLPGYGVRSARIDAAPAEVARFLAEGGFIEGEYQPLGEFSEPKPATEDEAAIFDAAVGNYPMIQAKADMVSYRTVLTGTEYLFTAKERENTIKVYVLAEEGKAPVFTQVCR